MTTSDNKVEEKQPENKIVATATKYIALIYAILVIPALILTSIGLRTVNEFGGRFSSWGVFWLCVGNYPITFFFTALIMWALRRRKLFTAALWVAAIPLVVLMVSFFFGYL